METCCCVSHHLYKRYRDVIGVKAVLPLRRQWGWRQWRINVCMLWVSRWGRYWTRLWHFVDMCHPQLGDLTVASSSWQLTQHKISPEKVDKTWREQKVWELFTLWADHLTQKRLDCYWIVWTCKMSYGKDTAVLHIAPLWLLNADLL